MVSTRRRTNSKEEEEKEEPQQHEEQEESSASESEEEDAKDEADVDISAEEIKHAIALATEAAKKTFGWNTNKKNSSMSNPLSDIIPGYIAPMTLDSSGLTELKSSKKKLAKETIGESQSTSTSISNKTNFASKNFKMAKKNPATLAANKTNAGADWFNFEASANSEALQADIGVIRNRNYIDPKKFYKASDFSKKGSHMVQLGTVIEGSMESKYSNRLTKKERRNNVAEEIMGEVFASKDDYVKKKFRNMQREKSIAGKKFARKGKKSFRKKR